MVELAATLFVGIVLSSVINNAIDGVSSYKERNPAAFPFLALMLIILGLVIRHAMMAH